jgi:molybdopterin converting factor small subunit
MNITAQFHGILTDWVGTPSASFKLPDDAAYSDLMKEIERRYKQNMPAQLWDQKARSFNKKVHAFKDGKALDPVDNPLSDRDIITFMLLIAGG